MVVKRSYKIQRKRVHKRGSLKSKRKNIKRKSTLRKKKRSILKKKKKSRKKRGGNLSELPTCVLTIRSSPPLYDGDDFNSPPPSYPIEKSEKILPSAPPASPRTWEKMKNESTDL